MIDASARTGRLRAAAIIAATAFLVVSIIGGIGAAIVQSTAEREAERIFARETAALGDTVARSVAQQVERALALGIPLAAIPGLEAWITEIALATPGVVAITIADAGGRLLARATTPTSPATEGASSRLAVQAGAAHVGEVTVATSAASLQATRDTTRREVIVAVLVAAALSAVAAAVLRDALLGRPLEALRDDLAAVRSGDVLRRPSDRWVRSAAAQRARAAYLARIDMLDQARLTLESYAAELRRADPDGTLAERIDAILADVGHAELALSGKPSGS